MFNDQVTIAIWFLTESEAYFTQPTNTNFDSTDDGQCGDYKKNWSLNYGLLSA